MSLPQTPSQTVGPFFAYGLTAVQYGYPFTALATPRVRTGDDPGPRIRLAGRVIDDTGAPIDDAMIEIWQADSSGRYAEPAAFAADSDAFQGFARAGTGTDALLRFVFDTVKPAATAPGLAPHIDVLVFMRGLLSHVYTRVYFDDEAAANAADPVLTSVPAERRATLIARREVDDEGVVYRWDIHMQGERETVFFDV